MIVAGLKAPVSGYPAVTHKDGAISEVRAGLAFAALLADSNLHLSQMQQKHPGQEGKTYLLGTEECH